MPCQYVREDSQRLIKVTVADPFTLAEFDLLTKRQLAEGVWPFAMLVDARAMVTPPQAADVRLFVASIQEAIAANGPRGPIAFVAKESIVIGRAQMYATLGGRAEAIEVFWHIDEAQRWLDERPAPGTKTTRPRTG